MINFLQETTQAVKDAGKRVSDVAWVGKMDGTVTCAWEEFEKLADLDYDKNYGGEEIDPALVVVFIGGGWLERSGEGGKEWWELKSQPQLTQNPKLLQRVTM